MSDIYKNERPMPMATSKPRKRRRKTSASGVFDEEAPRRRRSRNSGFRRILHLLRKPHNEKRIWIGFLIAAIVFLIGVAIWQFGYKEMVAREKNRQKEAELPVYSVLDDSSVPE